MGTLLTVFFLVIVFLCLAANAGTITVFNGNSSEPTIYTMDVDPGLVNNPNGIIQDPSITIYTNGK